jgi:hypothetical protein
MMTLGMTCTMYADRSKLQRLLLGRLPTVCKTPNAADMPERKNSY